MNTHTRAMKTSLRNLGLRPTSFPLLITLIFARGFISSSASAAVSAARTFTTPQEAVTALDNAVNTTNRQAFVTLFGPEAQELANPDTVQGAREMALFAAAFNVTNH